MTDSDADSDPFDPVELGHVGLSTRRNIDRDDLPPDLAAFYAAHEGVGLESKGHHSIRIAKLSEVTMLAWKDLGLSPEPPHAGWVNFSALRIGFSDYGDEIVYVLTAPGIPTGSVLALGVGAMTGPAGEDKNGPVGALVLGATFGEWAARMDRLGAGAHGLYHDMDLPDWVTDVVEDEIARLNPFSKRARTR